MRAPTLVGSVWEPERFSGPHLPSGHGTATLSPFLPHEMSLMRRKTCLLACRPRLGKAYWPLACLCRASPRTCRHQVSSAVGSRLTGLNESSQDTGAEDVEPTLWVELAAVHHMKLMHTSTEPSADRLAILHSNSKLPRPCQLRTIRIGSVVHQLWYCKQAGAG